jgi:hypothetical protein
VYRPVSTAAGGAAEGEGEEESIRGYGERRRGAKADGAENGDRGRGEMESSEALGVGVELWKNGEGRTEAAVGGRAG